MANSDLAALKAYVTAPGNSGRNQAESTVLLHVTHSNLKAEFLEIRFDLSSTVLDVKRKLATHCGTSVSAMGLQLKDDRGTLLADLCNERRLGYYSPRNGYVLHIIDTDPCSASANGWLEDLSKVPKYVMSDADYSRRDNTYRKYKQSKLKEDANWTLDREMAQRTGRTRPEGADRSPYTMEAARHITVGDRCEVAPGGRRGTVRYVGELDMLPAGVWVGIEYDEPLGKNDGSIGSMRVFTCATNHGAFVRADNVTVGDFSELCFLDSDDEV